MGKLIYYLSDKVFEGYISLIVRAQAEELGIKRDIFAVHPNTEEAFLRAMRCAGIVAVPVKEVFNAIQRDVEDG